METKRIYFKSDFAIELPLEEDLSKPFALLFYSDIRCHNYIASFDGTNFCNCRILSNGNLKVTFDDHRLGIGFLKMEKHFGLSPDDFSPVPELHFETPENATTIESGETKYVELFLK